MFELLRKKQQNELEKEEKSRERGKILHSTSCFLAVIVHSSLNRETSTNDGEIALPSCGCKYLIDKDSLVKYTV